jgi:hypothetical protein
MTLAEVIAPLLGSPRPIEPRINATPTNVGPVPVPKHRGRLRKVSP